MLNLIFFFSTCRRKQGAFKCKDGIKSPQHVKGYRLRDTDDRLTRLKSDPLERERPSAQMTGAALYGNGIIGLKQIII